MTQSKSHQSAPSSGQQVTPSPTEQGPITPQEESKLKAAGRDATANAANLVGCGTTEPNVDGKTGDFTDAARIRTGPSTSCTALGDGFPGQGATYFCFVIGQDGGTWTYLRNNTTGVTGWVRDTFLSGVGSSKLCPGS